MTIPCQPVATFAVAPAPASRARAASSHLDPHADRRRAALALARRLDVLQLASLAGGFDRVVEVATLRCFERCALRIDDGGLAFVATGVALPADATTIERAILAAARPAFAIGSLDREIAAHAFDSIDASLVARGLLRARDERSRGRSVGAAATALATFAFLGALALLDRSAPSVIVAAIVGVASGAFVDAGWSRATTLAGDVLGVSVAEDGTPSRLCALRGVDALPLALQCALRGRAPKIDDGGGSCCG